MDGVAEMGTGKFRGKVVTAWRTVSSMSYWSLTFLEITCWTIAVVFVLALILITLNQSRPEKTHCGGEAVLYRAR